MDDKDIQKRLSEMPQIKDHRSKEVILARLKADERLKKPTQHRNLPRWLPVFAAVASVLVLLLLLPPMFEQDEVADKQDHQASIASDRDGTLANSEYEMDLQLSDEAEEYASVAAQEFVDKIEPFIPGNVTYDVWIENGVVRIHFKDLLDLSQFPNEDTEAMIEGFILTADHFQTAVQLENILQKSFGEYDLEAPLPGPAAINR